MHIAKFRVQKELNTNVALLRLFPGISEITVRNFLAAPIQGVVLETYGAGNAPARADIIQALKEACDRGVVIVNCTQCRKGLVTDAYATGKQLARIGVVAGADMTPECALTKLSYLLGSMADQPDQVRRLMGKNLRGELTVIAPFQRFSATNTRTNALIETIMMLSAHAQRVAMEGFEGDRVPDLTMSLEDQQLAEKVLGPVLLCSAAGASDVKGVADLFGGMGEMINLNCADYDGRVPLHVACREGHVRTVEFLLQHGASIHLRDRTGHTPLFDAVAYKRVEVVQLLVSTGAYWTENEIEDFGPIWLRAAKDGDIKKMKIALDAGWRVNWAEPVENRRALDVAVCQGRISVLKVLVGQPDLDLDLQDRWGFSIWDKLGMLKQATEVSERQGTHHKLEATIITQMEAILASKGANSTAQGQPN